MQRLIFWGILILLIVLLFSLIDYVILRVLRLLMSRQTASTVNVAILSILALTIGLSVWIGSTQTRLDLQPTHTTISSSRLPKSFDGFKIAQISDLHIGSFEPAEGNDLLLRLCDVIAEAQPDVIVFTGDMVTLRAAEAYPFRKGLSALSHIPMRDDPSAMIPVYSVLGNHDYADYMRDFSPERRQQDVDSLIDLQTAAGWQVLRNECILLPSPRHKNDTRPEATESIALVGVENIGEPPFSVYGDLSLAMQDMGGYQGADSCFTILLSHNPTHWRSEVLPNTAIDLTLSGHTHAMQLVIGSWSPSKWKYAEWMGLYTEGDQHLYVNPGFGTVGPPVRIGIAPEVSILTLHRP